VRDNLVQFAVVREDPELEWEVLKDRPHQRLMMIGSGGCTALTLQSRMPDSTFVLIEPNPAQIDLLQRKVKALQDLEVSKRHRAFDILPEGVSFAEGHVWDGLSQCGNFESLFKGLRLFIEEFVWPREKIESFFLGDGQSGEALKAEVFEHAYWPVAFDLYLHDSLLNTMFGPDATQHAPAGSYPGYFRKLLERGLLADGARDNYFLHHLFLGHYIDRPGTLPDFITRPAPDYHFEIQNKMMLDVQGVEDVDFVGLSNIIDWMQPDDVKELALWLGDQMKPGSVVMYRQLNNEADVEGMFGERFEFDTALGESLHAQDRSLFYSSVHVGTRR